MNLRDDLKGEVAFVIVEGYIEDQGKRVNAGQMMINKTHDACRIKVPKGTTLLLFGGEPMEEERHLLWNFASTSKERLQQAKQDWIDKKFQKVPGDDTYIPFP